MQLTHSNSLKNAWLSVRTLPVSSWMPYVLGRFRVVRKMYSKAVWLAQAIGAAPKIPFHHAPVLPDIEPRVAAKNIRENAAFFGVRAPPSAVSEIGTYARTHMLRHWKTDELFMGEQVRDGRLPSGKPAVLADVLDASGCESARRIAYDRSLIETVGLYLGYHPMAVDVRILWSFVSDASEEYRRSVYQTIDFHYDVHAYSFAYCNIYLTDVTEFSGAHVMVCGSHKKKPLKMLYGSARATDEQIYRMYPKEQIVSIVGDAGTGFVQDSSCYHKVLSPKTNDRLMLHLRYY